ncbi:MAG: HAMP domain-containing sensor histidine kinase, partial [Pseudomonadota bacterium]
RREIRDEPESVYLRQCVAQIAAPYSDEMARKGLDFDLEIAESAVLQLNRKALQLVVGNLIKNAVRYTSSGFVRVSYATPRLTVSDSGPGISPQHREHIFERYFRLDDKPGGLGLGLAIVRRICDDRGWKIELKCPPGAGSAFTVVLA